MNDLQKTMSKKQWREHCKRHRVVNGFNTGTRDMKSEKYPTRARQKEIDRREMECAGARL